MASSSSPPSSSALRLRSGSRLALRAATLGSMLQTLACSAGDDSAGGAPGADDPSACVTNADGGASVQPLDLGPPLSPTRLLRRLSLRLTDAPPSMEAYEALAKADTAGQEAALASFLEQTLRSPQFYRTMLRFAHDTLGIGEVTSGFYGEGYQGNLSAHLSACPDDTVHAGVLYAVDPKNYGKFATGQCQDASLEIVQVTPWWNPASQVRMFASQAPGPATSDSGVDCSQSRGSLYETLLKNGCGCGPDLRYCIPHSSYRDDGTSAREASARRMAWDEPARLFAHVVWHDRPLSDIVLANYSVAPVLLKHAYMREAQGMDAGTAIDSVRFFDPADYAGSPSSPDYDPASPLAWHEFVVEKYHPFYLSLAGNVASGDVGRTYHFDPRQQTGQPLGIPYAGILTTTGFLSSFPRERVRGARALEIFACRDFVPPPGTQTFPPYHRDPAVEGSCLHCHTALDPASIFFKRMTTVGYGTDRLWAGFGASGQPSANGEPWVRFRRVFAHDTRLTPVTAEQLEANPQAAFLDFLPPDQSLFGQVSDGTNGPLGLGKLLVLSGQLDQCMVQRFYQMMMGRRIGASEASTLTALTEDFVRENRNVRKLITRLAQRDEFRRGL